MNGKRLRCGSTFQTSSRFQNFGWIYVHQQRFPLKSKLSNFIINIASFSNYKRESRTHYFLLFSPVLKKETIEELGENPTEHKVLDYLSIRLSLSLTMPITARLPASHDVSKQPILRGGRNIYIALLGQSCR